MENSEIEKTQHAETVHYAEHKHHLGGEKAFALYEETLRSQLATVPTNTLKTSEDGVPLIPQPSSNPLDPLNWSTRKKWGILIMISAASCTADYAAATGATAIIPQAEEWHLSPDTVNHATTGNTFMLGAGGIIAVILSAYMGRLPVLFYFNLFAAATAAWEAGAQSFESYMAARILNGFFGVAAAAGGLMLINDIYFFHEKPRAINFWSTALVLSPFLGPCFMAGILTVSTWRSGMWLNLGITLLSLSLVVILGEETFYPRHHGSESVPEIYKRSKLLRLVGYEQLRMNYTTNTLRQAGWRILQVALKPPVFVVCLFYFFDFGWVIGNNTTISVFVIPVYQFSYRGLAALYVAPIVGGILAMILGHFIFDFVAIQYVKWTKDVQPESRLIPVWLVLPLKLIGYNLIGSSIQHHWSYWVLAAGWGMHNFSTVITTDALAAYLIDAYPEASGESAALLNAARTLAGFVVGYVQIRWAQSSGTQLEYGIQTAIMGAAFVFLFIPMHFFGRQLRERFGQFDFKTN